MRDVIRPLILKGWTDLAAEPAVAKQLSLERLYLAVMVGAKQLKVRLRPELRQAESLHVVRDVGKAVDEEPDGRCSRHDGTAHADGAAAAGLAACHVRHADGQVLRPNVAGPGISSQKASLTNELLANSPPFRAWRRQMRSAWRSFVFGLRSGPPRHAASGFRE